jgi:hypothetical protein
MYLVLMKGSAQRPGTWWRCRSSRDREPGQIANLSWTLFGSDDEDYVVS